VVGSSSIVVAGVTMGFKRFYAAAERMDHGVKPIVTPATTI